MMTDEEFNYLQAKYRTPFALPPEVTGEEQLSLGSRFGQQLANVPSMAIEGLMGIGTGIANLAVLPEEAKLERTRVPRVFDVPAAQTVGEHLTDLGPNLLGVAPQFLVPGGIIGKGAQLAGASGRAANVLGQVGGGLFGGLSESPTGAVAEGAVGAVQGLAERLPRGQRALFALGAGAVGAGQAMVAEQSTTGSMLGDMLTFGVANAAATFAGSQIPAMTKLPEVKPHAPTGPIPFKVGPDSPKDIGALKLAPPAPPVAPGIPFYEVPPPLDIGGGRPIAGQPAVSNGGLRMPTPMQGLDFGTMGTGAEFAYGRGIDPYDVFAGLQRPPILTQGETFPTGLRPFDPRMRISETAANNPDIYGRGNEYDVFASLQKPPLMTQNELFPTPTPRVFDPRIRMSETALSGADIYGGATNLFDVTQGLQRAPIFGPENIFSPGEAAARAQLEAKRTAASTPTESRSPALPSGKLRKPIQERIPSGLSKLLDESVGWHPTGDLKEGGSEALALRLQDQKAIDRARKTAEMYRAEGDEARAGYFDDAANKAVARLQKPETAGEVHKILPAIRIGGKRILGEKGDTHQNILDRYLNEFPDEVDALLNFDTKQNPNFFVDSSGNELSRAAMKKKFGIVDSQGLRELQMKGAPPPKQEPVKPAAAPVASAIKTNKYTLEKNKYGETYEATVTPITEADKTHKYYQGETHRVSIFRRTDKGDVVAEGHGYASSEEQAQFVLEELTPGSGKPWNKRDVSYGVPEHLQGWKAVSPIEKETPPADMVRVRGRHGMEDARVIGREGDTLHVEIDDPIFGPRQATVLASDTQPVARLQEPLTPKGGVPFKDVQSAKLTGKEGASGAAWAGESERELLGSVMEGSGPGATRKTLPGKQKEVLSVEEGLKKLPAEAAAVIGEIIHRLQVASGQSIDTSLALRMVGAKGDMYELSGRVAINLQWVNGMVKNWDKMSEETRARALMRVAALYGHEISHVAHKFAEKSGLAIDGVPITKVVIDKVGSMSQVQRNYIAEQILTAKGEIAPSKGVLAYLSGDIDQVYGWYKWHRPDLTREGAVELAAGEVLAEIGSIELVKRMRMHGLPDMLRQAIDKFKEVLVRVADYFRTNKKMEAVASLQSLQDISAKMYDHFAAGDTAALHKAFPASKSWSTPPVKNPYSSGSLPPEPSGAPHVDIDSGLLKGELARLGVSAAVGGTIGGFVGPEVGPNQISTAEGIILGGIAGIFGPAVAKKLLSGNLTAEIKAASAASKGNPLKTLGHVLGGGKTLRELGQEGRYGWTGISSTMAKMVRFIESEFDLNLDPKMKALVEQARGEGAEQLAIVQDALDKVRWYRPSATLTDAVDNYFQGKISKDEFEALLDTAELKTYGQFITTAREAMTTLTKMYASGMGRSGFRDHLIKTSDQYLGRFYSAYKEGKFNMEAFDRAKQDFLDRYQKEGYTDETVTAIMHEFMREVKANQNMFGRRRGNSGQKIDSSTTYRRLATEEEIEAQAIVVGGLEHNPFSPEYKKEKAKYDWMLEHKITDNWRDWLGEYKNPVERMIYTFQKVYPSAISARVFDMLDNKINSNGLKFAYSAKELQGVRKILKEGISSSTDPVEIARLQNQLKELEGYGAIPQGSAYGKLQGKWVDRFTRDEINTYATPYKWMEQPIIRGIAEFNNLIKIGRTAFNPITVIRNIWQMPTFALISQAKLGDIGEAYKIIHHLKDDDYRLMLRRHIIGADYVSSELSKGPGSIFSGYMDSDIAVKTAKLGAEKILKFYQQPDMLVRAGAFISARRRFAKRAVEEGKFASLQDAMKDESVIDQAVNFTQRYTMNYATVPRIVKIGRQLPFVNLFISYTSEITRILKNLIEDAISPGPNSAGRMHAITVLGAMAAIPAGMTAFAEGQLSERDKQDWDKMKKLSPVYNRGRFRIPTGRDKKTGNFTYFDITNLLPADNYSQMIKAFAEGDTSAAAAANPLISLQNTPLLNMITEQITGQDLRTGQDISGFGRVREVLKETLPPWVPPGYEGQRLIRAFSENAEGGTGLTNMKTGVQYKPSDVIANYLTGMRFGNVSLATVQKSAISEAKQEIAAQQSLLSDILRMNTSAEKKAQARAIYDETVQQIMMRLHSKMQAN